MISVGASNTIVQILSSALHYWEKLGLRPRGGKKDVTAFVFFEEEDEERQQQIENWFGSLSAAYSVSDCIPFCRLQRKREHRKNLLVDMLQGPAACVQPMASCRCDTTHFGRIYVIDSFPTVLAVLTSFSIKLLSFEV